MTPFVMGVRLVSAEAADAPSLQDKMSTSGLAGGKLSKSGISCSNRDCKVATDLAFQLFRSAKEVEIYSTE